MTTYFRVQTADRDVNELLDPGYQFSHAYNRNELLTRRGVSACVSLEDLAEYLVSGISGALDVRESPCQWSIVVFEGEDSDDPRGAVDPGEVLGIPSRIVSVTPVDDDFLALMDRVELEVFGEPEMLWDD